MLALVFLSVLCAIGCWLACPPGHELEQTALLPFADDPEAAARMTEATGRRCERVIEPVLETQVNVGHDRFMA
ncbi:hypothetical protein D9M71_488600 [compost metagenome]